MTTSEGNEYFISKQLIDEIKDELFILGGRANTVSLAKDLNVDINQLNLNVTEIVREKELHLVAECLIANYYLEEIAREINLKLQIQGQISVKELTLQFDLPADILQHDVLEKYLGTIISGRPDPYKATIFYTEEYISRTKAKLRGGLMGLLKPTFVLRILEHFNLEQGLFFYLFDQLNDPGTISDTSLRWAWYLPLCHLNAEKDYFIDYYKKLNYLDYSYLSYCEVLNVEEFAKKLLHNEDTICLKGCIIDIKLKQELENAVQKCIASKTYLNVKRCLNFCLHNEDIENFLLPLLKNYNNSIILFNKSVLSIQFIETIKKKCLPMIQEKTESVVMCGKYQQYLEKNLSEGEGKYTLADHKAERSKQVVQNSGSNEVIPPSQNTPSGLEIISIEDIENTIKKNFEYDLNELFTLDDHINKLVTQIAEYIKGDINQTALAIAKEFSEKLFEDAHNRKLTNYSAQNRINLLMNDINLYEKGLKLLPSAQQPQFIKYLLKSFGGDVLSEFCKHAANQCNFSIQADILSEEQRHKIINDLSEEYMKPLRALNSVLDEHNMEQFYQAVDVCLSECGMVLKKINKKKDRLLVHNHREKLISEIENCEEPALVLQLVVFVLFTIVTQNMLHASGIQIPLIIHFLKSQLKEDDFDKLHKYHEMVANYLTAADEDKDSIHEKLKEDLPSLKSIVTDVEKYINIIEIEKQIDV